MCSTTRSSRQRHLRDQHDVGAAGDARGDGDVAGVAAHHLQHHDPLVAGAGRVQAVERLGGDGDGRRVADRPLGIGDVVVDGLGNADEGQAVDCAISRRRMSRLPSPPTPISPSSCSSPAPRPSRPNDPSGCRSSIGKAKGSPRLVLPRKVPPWRASAASSRPGSSGSPRPADAAGRACRGGCRSSSSRSHGARAAPRRGWWRSRPAQSPPLVQDSDSLGHERLRA